MFVCGSAPYYSQLAVFASPMSAFSFYAVFVLSPGPTRDARCSLFVLKVPLNTA